MRYLLILGVLPVAAAAQMPGVPVLQNAWATPGLVAAVNFAGGSGGSVWALAGGWAPGGARVQLSGGAGMQSGSGAGSRGVYGVRGSLPFGDLMGGRLGLSAFAGVGGGGGASEDSSAAKTVVPVGVGVGYRQPFGDRGFSVYATPSYIWASGTGGSSALIRVAVGVDVGLTRNIGVTGGVDFGQTASAGSPGPSGTRYAAGGSYALGRR